MVSPVAQLPVESAPASDPRLRKAAQDFEAMLLDDLLKMSNADGDSAGDGDQALHGYDDLRNQAVATALARDGGIGIARMIMARLDRADNIKVFSSPADSSIAGIFRGD